MDSTLVITNTKKSAAVVAKLLDVYSVSDIFYVQSGGEARRIMLERDFDLVIINSPLLDETGENLARQIAQKGISQVILIVKSEIYEMVFGVCEKDGVLTIAKPMNTEIFRQAFCLAKSMKARLIKAQSENELLKQKIDNIRINDHAKAILISVFDMNENEAHKYIEKCAMDTRTTKREIGEKIIRNYENGKD